ncbi:hypothetical protein PthstB1num2_28150 [Parageobacillus thermoglucosidasius]|nr:hypothetical protein PthstB1num2_28150 [Parageobacillus thermoglucosidasius]
MLVDEAQDYSPFQFEYLKCLFPSARMTALGDFNQAIFAHASETTDFHTLTSLYGPDETDVITLTRSYRSTRPIVEFTRGLVPGGEQITAFERDGDRPVLTRVPDHAELHRCSRYNTDTLIILLVVDILQQKYFPCLSKKMNK